MSLQTKERLFTNRKDEYEDEYEDEVEICTDKDKVKDVTRTAIKTTKKGIKTTIKVTTEVATHSTGPGFVLDVIKLGLTIIIVIIVLICSMVGINNLMGYGKPKLSAKQVEDLKEKIQEINEKSKRYPVTYANSEAQKCNWIYAISAILAKSNNNLDNIDKTENNMIEVATYSGGYADIIQSYHNLYQLPFDVYLIYGLIKQESDWNPSCSSGAGAYGLTQFLPSTFYSIMGSSADITDPKQQIEAACKYLKTLYDLTGDITLMLAAYNAGPGAVQAFNGVPPYAETQNYVKQVPKWAEMYRNGTLNIPDSIITGTSQIQRIEVNYVEASFYCFVQNRVVQDLDTALKSYGLDQYQINMAKRFIKYKDYFKKYFGNDYNFNFQFLSSNGNTNAGEGITVTGGTQLQMSIVNSARKLKGKPYRYGGNYPPLGLDDGTDCSGLCQWAYNDNGISISRTTFTQINDGIEVYEYDLQPGDLIFPRGKTDNGHVFLYAGKDIQGNHVCIEAPYTGTVITERVFYWNDTYRARRIIVN